jgi:PKD repeat protein
MKRTVFTLLLIAGFAIGGFAQAQIFSVTTLPDSATCNDTVYVIVGGYWLNCEYEEDSSNWNVFGATLYVHHFWHEDTCPAGTVNQFLDTIAVGPLNQGYYSINYTIYDSLNVAGNHTMSNITVGSCCPAQASFTASDTVVCNGGTLNFTNTSTGGIGSYEWKHNGNLFSTSTNTSRTFSTPGYHTITLIAADSGCYDSVSKVIGVKSPPSASFNYVNTLKDYQFYDQSNAWKPEFMWDFGDINSDTAQHPSHSYADTGNYTVCLTVTNTCGTDSTCQNIDVTCPLPKAGFSFTVDSLTITFTDTSSSNTDTWFWTFGDGNFTAVKSPSYTWSGPGTYEVCLKVTNACGEDSLCISVTLGNVGFDLLNKYGVTVYPNPVDEILFIDGLPIGEYNIKLTDIVGRMRSLVLNGRSISPNLTPGIYMMEILEDGVPVYFGKLIRLRR